MGNMINHPDLGYAMFKTQISSNMHISHEPKTTETTSKQAVHRWQSLLAKPVVSFRGRNYLTRVRKLHIGHSPEWLVSYPVLHKGSDLWKMLSPKHGIDQPAGSTNQHLTINHLVGGPGPPLWKIWTSIGMMKFPIYGKIKNGNQTTNQS